MKRLLLITLLILSCLCMGEEIASSEAWSKMSPAQQHEMREKYRAWNKLPNEEKQKLEKNYENFAKTQIK